MEVVVVLGDVSQDAEAVGDLQRHHVFGVQQGRNPQLLLRNPEGLETTNTHIRGIPTHTLDTSERTDGNRGLYRIKSDSQDPLKAPEPAGTGPRWRDKTDKRHLGVSKQGLQIQWKHEKSRKQAETGRQNSRESTNQCGAGPSSQKRR